ncbi:pseudaminic acid synthase [Alphaproteobacteria bacterium]|nr:pseudaminic acid synthase [Alphaproteobacteria bacterium]
MTLNNFSINSQIISKDLHPYIIAEVSANHNGSILRAKETIRAAKNAGVDAVKIQTYTPDTMTIEVENPDFYINDGLWKGRSLYDLYSEAHTPFEWHKELFSYANEIGVTLFSSPFDETAVDLLDSLGAPAFKVASFEVIDLPLVKYIARKQKPILMSTGMASLEEIGDAIEAAKSVGNDNILLFHCVSSYPTPLTGSNLNMIQILQKQFNIQVGLSDHTIGNLASIVATSMGAAAIEKHFTLNRSDGGVDSSFSLEPEEMKLLVKETKEAFSALGATSFARSSVEEGNKVFRRSLYFVNDVNEGDVITEDFVRRIRPGFGLEPKYYDLVIGATCLMSAKRGDRVTLEHFDLGKD